MLYKFCFVAITLNLIVVTFLSAVAGKAFIPWWGYELAFSFYWLTTAFRSINITYLNPFNRRTDIWDLKPLIAWVFSIHWIEAYVLSFAILAPFGVPWYYRWPIAYFGGYVVIVAIPMQLAVIFYPKLQKKLESTRIDPNDLRDLAMQCGEARRFVRRFPHVRYFACDHAFKNQEASCVLLHRISRPEREGLMEDAVLSVPVDMSVRKPICDRIKTERYIFCESNGRSAVFHLSTDHLMERHSESIPLDEDALSKFDYSMDRYPSLEEAPFPLAIRDVFFEKI